MGGSLFGKQITSIKVYILLEVGSQPDFVLNSSVFVFADVAIACDQDVEDDEGTGMGPAGPTPEHSSL